MLEVQDRRVGGHVFACIVPSQESESSCICLFRSTSQESEWSFICTLEVQARGVSGHVFVR